MLINNENKSPFGTIKWRVRSTCSPKLTETLRGTILFAGAQHL